MNAMKARITQAGSEIRHYSLPMRSKTAWEEQLWAELTRGSVSQSFLQSLGLIMKRVKLSFLPSIESSRYSFMTEPSFVSLVLARIMCCFVTVAWIVTSYCSWAFTVHDQIMWPSLSLLSQKKIVRQWFVCWGSFAIFRGDEAWFRSESLWEMCFERMLLLNWAAKELLRHSVRLGRTWSWRLHGGICDLVDHRMGRKITSACLATKSAASKMYYSNWAMASFTYFIEEGNFKLKEHWNHTGKNWCEVFVPEKVGKNSIATKHANRNDMYDLDPTTWV